MGGVPSIVHERLEQLAIEFRDSLPHRREEISSFLTQSKTGDFGSTRELRMRVHRLAGTARTFGYRELNRTAKEVEESIEKDLSIHSKLTESSVALVDNLVEALHSIPGRSTEEASTRTGGRTSRIQFLEEELENSDTREFESDALPEEQDHDLRKRTVIVVGAIEGLPEDFGEQLAVFGMLMVAVEEPRDIRHYLDHLPTDVQAGTEEHCVVLSSVSYFAERMSRLKEIATIREAFPDQVFTVLVGQEDDFRTRLRSVRYGADAFVPVPLDTAVLIDKLDAVTKQDTEDPYHVLIVDDDPEQVSDTALALQQAGMITSVVTDPSNIFQVLVEYQPELILMDMYMPQCTGVELSAIIRQSESFVSIPIIFLSVENDPVEQLAAMRNGAEDFIVKPFDPEKLVTSIRIRAARTRSMRFYMERDSLTGLLNHTNLKQRLGHELQRSRRIGTELVFAMIDIDKFKGVNDTYGHLTGDRVLKSLARLLTERLRRTDVIGRYGGEEFGVILFNTNTVHAFRIMNEIRESFAKIRQTNGTTEFSVTFSCGLAEFPGFQTAQSINEAADTALYEAKQRGRNRVVVAEGSD